MVGFGPFRSPTPGAHLGSRRRRQPRNGPSRQAGRPRLGGSAERLSAGELLRHHRVALELQLQVLPLPREFTDANALHEAGYTFPLRRQEQSRGTIPANCRARLSVLSFCDELECVASHQPPGRDCTLSSTTRLLPGG